MCVCVCWWVGGKPVRRQALPEGNAPICAAGQDPGVWHSFGFCAHTHIRLQAEAQQQAAQQGGVVLAVPLGGTESAMSPNISGEG